MSPSDIVARIGAAPIFLLVLTTLCWASHAIAGQLIDGSISPMVLVLLRWLIVLALLWPLFGREAQRRFKDIRPRLGSIALTSFLGFTGFNALFYMASLYTTAVNVGILQGAMPLMVFAFDYLFNRQRLTTMQAIGAPIAVVGVVIVATGGDVASAFRDGLNIGDVFMLAAVASYALYAIRLRNRPEMPGVVFLTLMAPIATLTALPLVAIEAAAGQTIWPDWEGWLIALYVALIPSTLAQIFFMRAVDLIGPGRAGVFVNLVPIFTAILAVVLLGETFAWHHALSLALVVAGIALSQSQSLRLPAHRR